MRPLAAGVSLVAGLLVLAPPAAAAQTAPDAAYACRQDIHPQDPAFPGVHVAALEEAPNGDLLYIFYAGREEQADDVATYMSRLKAGAEDWIAPRVIFDEPNHPDGNAVLWVDDDNDVVHLLFSVIMGENNAWTEAELRMQSSTDNGETWSGWRYVREDWGWLFGTLPFRMSNGEVLVPIYSEDEWASGWYTSSDNLQTFEVHPSDDDTTWPRSLAGMIQPATVELEPGHLVALNRSRDFFIWRTESTDYGRTWTGAAPHIPAPEEEFFFGARDATPTTLANNNSRIALIKLANGNLVLAHNPERQGRSPLRLSLSEDGGATWPVSVDVEAEAGEEFSYPYLLQSSDGFIHLGYTHRRESMRHLVFTEEFVRTGPNIPSNASFDVKAEYRDGALTDVAACNYTHNAAFAQTQQSETPPPSQTTSPSPSGSVSPSPSTTPAPASTPATQPSATSTVGAAQGSLPATGGGAVIVFAGAALMVLAGRRRRS